jgi:hypothetical protein
MGDSAKKLSGDKHSQDGDPLSQNKIVWDHFSFVLSAEKSFMKLKS